MNNVEVKLMMEKMSSSCKKVDEAIQAVEKDVDKLTKKRNSLKEEVEKLRDQISRFDKDLSTYKNVSFTSEQKNQRKLQENMVLAGKIGNLNWEYTWHNIIAENQRAELSERMNKLSTSISDCTNRKNHSADKRIDEDRSEIIHLKNLNENIEHEINLLRISLPTKEAIDVTEKEISALHERNEKILNQLRGQIGYIKSHNLQTTAFLENLKTTQFT